MGPNVWKENFEIRSYEVDCHGRLSVTSIFNFMQEAAAKHAQALGVSIRQLLSENFTWLLSRLKLKMTSYPQWSDQLNVYTWPSGTQSLFALRDFHLKDQNNQSVGVALSAWLVVDIHKRRPARISSFVERLKPIGGAHIRGDRLDKLPRQKSYRYERRFRVRYRDLDINQHVNNASYVEWTLESIPAAIRNNTVLSELEIDFLAESFLDNRIIARWQSQNTDQAVFAHSLEREEDGLELVRARTVWRLLR
jgi:medium-chain acyl-[acyl-carrier-protein] hydrolase